MAPAFGVFVLIGGEKSAHRFPRGLGFYLPASHSTTGKMHFNRASAQIKAVGEKALLMVLEAKFLFLVRRRGTAGLRHVTESPQSPAFNRWPLCRVHFLRRFCSAKNETASYHSFQPGHRRAATFSRRSSTLHRERIGAVPPYLTNRPCARGSALLMETAS